MIRIMVFFLFLFLFPVTVTLLADECSAANQTLRFFVRPLTERTRTIIYPIFWKVPEKPFKKPTAV